MVKKVKPIVIRPKSESEWLELRKKTIGASEVITVCGLNPWKSPYELWLEKTGRKAPDEVNDSMIRGKIYEAPLVDFWAIKTGHRPIKGSQKDILYVDRNKPYLSCTPDRFFIHASTGKKWLCEVKNPDNRRIEEAEQSWIMQLHWQMGITGIHEGLLLWDYPQRGVYFMEQEFTFNKELYLMMEEIVDEFWNENILKDIEPEMTVGSDVLYKYPEQEVGLSVEANDSLTEKYGTMLSLQESISTDTSQLDKLKDEVKLFMLNAESVKYEGKTLFTWKANKNKSRIFKIIK